MSMLSRALLVGLSIGSSATAQIPDYINVLPLPVPTDAWIWAGSPPGDRTRLFVMEGGGTIRILDITPPASPGGLPTYTLRATPFATVASGQARSVAFAPDFSSSGKFYVAYELNIGASSRVIEMSISGTDPNVADPATTRTVRDFPGVTFDHALGSMHFAPDGFLYIGVGDNFNSSNGQSIANVFGKMLRIDPTGDDFPADATKNYRIPTDNPLVARAGAAPEIWHIGIRNPWRWSFDRWNGDMWICDVGGGRAGEVDHLTGTGTPYQNLGWPIFDGTSGPSGTPHPDFTIGTLTPPALSINREGNQCSTSGGIMYRGNDVRPWRGRFFWSDWCTAKLYSAKLDGANLVDLQDHTTQLRHAVTNAAITFNNVSMIAEDGAGELYILQASRGTISGGVIYRIVPAGTQPLLADVGSQGGLPGPDGQRDNNDFVVYIDLFFNNDPAADVGIQGGLPGTDQTLDNNDFIVFINAFFE